jgi:hypothetical protein
VTNPQNRAANFRPHQLFNQLRESTVKQSGFGSEHRLKNRVNAKRPPDDEDPAARLQFFFGF